MDHAAIKAQYVAHLNALRQKPYSPEGDREELCCRRVIDALDALDVAEDNTAFARQAETPPGRGPDPAWDAAMRLHPSSRKF